MLSILKDAINKYDEKVMADKKLNVDQKYEIFKMTSIAYVNCDSITEFAVDYMNDVAKISRGSRALGFFQTLWNITKTLFVSMLTG